MKDYNMGYSFLRYPRALIDSPLFSHISIEARTLLALILDRYSLSSINSERFSDENGEIYVIYTLEEVSKKFGCGNTKTLRIFRELEEEGMIKRKRKNRTVPYRIYVSPSVTEFIKQEPVNAENNNSRVRKTETRDFSKSEDINNKYSNNYISKNHSSIIGFERTEDEIKEQIEYDCIVCDANKNLLDEMVMIIYDVLNGSSETVRVGKDEMPRGAVIARFCKLNSEHIFYVFSKLCSNEAKIINIKSYLITMLYNAPCVMESEVTAEFAYHHKSS